MWGKECNPLINIKYRRRGTANAKLRQVYKPERYMFIGCPCMKLSFTDGLKAVAKQYLCIFTGQLFTYIVTGSLVGIVYLNLA
jgi:hypothetical protein